MNTTTLQTIRYSFQKRIHGKKGYFLAYTVLFSVTTFIVFSWYFLKGRTLIWNSDGWTQHYKALVCYSRYLRSIARELFINHQFILPEWDFSIGEGSDVLGTLHYYVIGDPFAILSAFVPVRFLHLYYNSMILLRLYLAGAAFSCLCFGTGHKSRIAILAGSITYVFCYWGIYNAARHPYFLNPMIYLPLMILGIEKIFQKGKPYLFIATVFLSAVSNFYFFYMIVLVTVIYTITKTAIYYSFKNWKEGFMMLLRIGALSIPGVLMAAVILLPMCYVFLNDARMSAQNAVPLFYPVGYYAQLFPMFISNGHPYWMCMGYAAPAVPAVFLLFLKRKNHLLKTLFIICIFISATPFLGHILNGFSYVANRWCWAFALVTAYLLSTMWPHLMNLTIKSKIALTICMLLYSLICLIPEQSRTNNIQTGLLLAWLFVGIILFIGNGSRLYLNKWKSCAALLLVLAGVFNNSFWKNSSKGENYAAQSQPTNNLYEQLTNNETMAVRATAETDHTDTFYRYCGDKLSINAGVLAGISSTQYYWTLSNPYVFKARTALGQREVSAYRYFGYDDRTTLSTLAAVRYYVSPESRPLHLPYGFAKAESQKHTGYTVYKNRYALPLGYTYDSYLPESEWQKLSDVDKQEAMLQALVLDQSHYHGPLKQTSPKLTSKTVDYTVKCNSEDVTQKDNTFFVKKARSTVTLKFKGLPNSETYLSIRGLRFHGQEIASKTKKNNSVRTEPTYTLLKMRSSLGTFKKLAYYTEEHRAYDNRHDFSVNFCYSKDDESFIRISFSQAGTYTYDSLMITCQPMEHYVDGVQERMENTMEHIKIDTNKIKGTIDLKEPKLLCLSIPYSTGWRAYIDGREAPLYQANIMHMALDVDSGKHSIQLEYHTPLLKEGIWISLLTFTLCGLYLVFRRLWANKRRQTGNRNQ